MKILEIKKNEQREKNFIVASSFNIHNLAYYKLSTMSRG